MHGLNELNGLFSAVGRGDFPPIKPKGAMFGRKTFYRVPLGDKDVWVKRYPDVDMPMLLTGDTENREIQFIQSGLPERLEPFFDLPYIGASCSHAMAAMRDVSDELQRFGPPNPPSPMVLPDLIWPC